MLKNNEFINTVAEPMQIGDIFANTNKAPDSVPKDPWKWPLCSDKQSNCSLMSDGGFRYIRKVLAPNRTAINLTNEKITYETLKKGVNADIKDCKNFEKAFENVKSFTDVQALVKSFYDEGISTNTTLHNWRDVVGLNGCLTSHFLKVELDKEEPMCPFYALTFSDNKIDRTCSL
jgi:hypothetical protein